MQSKFYFDPNGKSESGKYSSNEAAYLNRKYKKYLKKMMIILAAWYDNNLA